MYLVCTIHTHMYITEYVQYIQNNTYEDMYICQWKLQYAKMHLPFIVGLIWFLLTKKIIAHIQQAFWCIDSLSYHVIIMADLIASAVSIALMVCSPLVIKFCGLVSDQEYQLRTYVLECSACCPLWCFFSSILGLFWFKSILFQIYFEKFYM